MDRDAVPVVCKVATLRIPVSPMSSKLITYGLTACLAVLGAAVVFALAGGGDRPPRVGTVTADAPPAGSEAHMDGGETAPNFVMPTLDGHTFRLEDYGGRVVVLNFWATWCAPCRVEIPDLIEMQSELGEARVRFVGISVDHEPEGVVRAFVEEAGINYPIVIDDGTVSDRYGGVYALPMTFVIDRDGVIRRSKTGLVRKGELMPFLEELAGG